MYRCNHCKSEFDQPKVRFERLREGRSDKGLNYDIDPLSEFCPNCKGEDIQPAAYETAQTVSAG